jgi:hypothetical protein
MSIKTSYLVFSIVTAVVVLFALVSGVWTPKDSPPLFTPEAFKREQDARIAAKTAEQEIHLQAEVVLNSLSVRITNRDPVNWSDIKMKINSDYELEASGIDAGTTRTFPSVNSARATERG